jgi:phage/plasmid-like protein (TIGR03299 family)
LTRDFGSINIQSSQQTNRCGFINPLGVNSMAHQISIRKNGVAEMAFTGERGWHGLGNELPAGATIEQWTKAAGMDWLVKRAPVRFIDHDGNTQQVAKREVLYRDDTKNSLGIVSPQFKIVQPGEVLEFFRDLTEGAGFTLETAGVLFGGQRFWALANIGERAVIGNADMVGGYVLLSTGCDGTIPTTADYTSIRVVCDNTLSMALSRKSKQCVTIGHRSHFNADEVKAQMGLARGKFAEFVNAMRDLSKVNVSEADAATLTAELLAPKEMASEQGISQKTLESKPFIKIMSLFKGDGMGSNLTGAAGTAWGWVNAVTEYTDHHARAHNADNRMDSAFFGKGDKAKTQAVELAMAL